MNDDKRIKPIHIFLAAGMIFLMGMIMPATLVFAAGASGDVSLHVEKVDYDRESGEMLLNASVTNNSSVTVPVCEVSFHTEDAGNGFLITGNGGPEWISGNAENFASSADEYDVNLSWTDMKPKEKYLFTIPYQISVPETEKSERLDNSIKGQIRISDPAKPSWESVSKVNIPLYIYTPVKPTEPPAATTTAAPVTTTVAPTTTTAAPTTEPEKMLALRSGSEGTGGMTGSGSGSAAGSAAENETYVIYSGAEAPYVLADETHIAESSGNGTSASGPAKENLPWLFAGGLLFVMFILWRILTYTRRCREENKMKFDPEKELHEKL
jgi:hypothetical protein